ncbi:hypothetical protein HMPREF1572_00818 [Gardnerella vaginalis JCP7275]|nr:hypothetical protein HMPREF1572_00818 [Gardnerella vaginalis JCP7275]
MITLIIFATNIHFYRNIYIFLFSKEKYIYSKTFYYFIKIYKIIYEKLHHFANIAETMQPKKNTSEFLIKFQKNLFDNDTHC